MLGVTGRNRDETRSVGHPRRWLWTGIILLVAAAIGLLVCLLADFEEVGEWALALLFLVCPFLISGIYCLRRGMKALALEKQLSSELAYEGQGGVKPSTFSEVKGFAMRKVIVQESPTVSKIVVKMPVWFRVVAWFELLFGVPLFLVGLGAIIAEGTDTDLWIPGLFGLLFIMLGIWMLGVTTKVTFNKSLGDINIARGHVPLFLWFLRTKCISREEARSAFSHSVQQWVSTGSTSGGTATFYETKVIMSSGKELKLYGGGTNQDVAAYLAKRILDFAQEVEVKSSPDAKFSMRVEEAFQATFASGALGMVVEGTVEQGTIRDGDEVEIRGYRGTKRAKVFEIDAPEGFAAGDNIRLLIEDLTERDVMLGDIVERV